MSPTTLGSPTRGRFSRAYAALAALLISPVLALTTTTAPAQAAPLAPGVTAYWEMNEAPGATVMADSGPNGLHAAIDQSGLDTGYNIGGATGYNWLFRSPEEAPASPERVIQIPDDPALEPGDGAFTIELRYRTNFSFGNITQKGQAESVGGQWKIQAPSGIPSCLFKGSITRIATNSITPLNDEAWHNVTCAFSQTGVTMYVDGLYRSRKNGTAGTIDNSVPMTIGGKTNCDQVLVTCDYFSGSIDFIKITKGANLLPTAAFTQTCAGQTCSFDASGSSDGDGSVARYLWDFGDGTTSTEPQPQHAYAAPGSYNVTLTVNDNQAADDSTTTALEVEANPALTSPVQFVNSVMSAANNSSAKVVVPATVAPGDRLLMVLSYNNLSRTVTTPAGWTQLRAVTSGTMGSIAYTKVAEQADAGATVTVPLSGSSKYTLTLSAYTGTALGPVQFASATDTIPNTSRPTPLVDPERGSWVASYWADKSSTTTTWTPEPSVTARVAGCNTDAGRICSALADTNAPVPALPYGQITATSGTPSDTAVMWSFVLAPKPEGNQPPFAGITASCTVLQCSFDGSGSGDPDGTITGYSWSFGDGTTSTQAAPSHTYAAAGTYTASLTVTDNEGATSTSTKSVTATAPPVVSPIAHVASTVVADSNSKPTVTVPSGVNAGDRLLLALSLSNTTRTFSAPAGWTQLDNIVAGTDLRTVFWTKVAAAGDPATLTVPLSGTSKYSITLAAYAGVSAGTPTFASTVDTTNHTARTTPAVTTQDGAWVISYWADRSSTTTVWNLPATVTGRASACATGTSRICSAFADTGLPVAAGPHAGVVANTDVASSRATMWSVVLAPVS
ncbi:MAG: PKD domain-containing protein [Nocardioides sp.]